MWEVTEENKKLLHSWVSECGNDDLQEKVDFWIKVIFSLLGIKSEFCVEMLQKIVSLNNYKQFDNEQECVILCIGAS